MKRLFAGIYKKPLESRNGGGTMSNSVLWRRLTETDFNAMHGNASPHGRGGGAMHVALGVGSQTFPIDKFLNAHGQPNITINTAAQPGKHGASSLVFGSNPDRRRGEWLIRDQFSHRHPAWLESTGFPATYNQSDPPYIFVFRVGNDFHVRFSTANRLSKLQPADRPQGLLSEPKGIRPAPPALLAALSVPQQTLLDTFEDNAEDYVSEPFDPKNITDGRKRVMASILQRLGQRTFRRKLLSAYEQQCAVTRCTTLWVLEAAHIIPYRGIKTNAVSNGLLLRADIHTLFDLALISIEPARMKIRVSSLLSKSQYAGFDGRVPALPRTLSIQPSMAALEEHYSQFHS
jgi:CheY-like chemotaxis protein